MRKNVVVDIDGVLADFEGAFCERFGYDNRERENLESRYPRNALAISDFVNDWKVYRDLKPLELGIQVIDYLHNRGDVWVTLVTARGEHLDTVTRRWLGQNHIRYHSISAGKDKAGRISLMKPICAIDDLLSVQDRISSLNVPFLIQAHPWNDTYRTDVNRFSNLSEFIRQFEAIIT